MQNPQISIIIPTYNRADFLPKTITSILNQTYQEWEAIIVDDASIDNTEEIVKGYQDSRIQYVSHKYNLGISAARNTGIKNSKGKYIALLDSDDEWLPEKLSCQMKIFQKEDLKCGVVCTSAYIVKDGKISSCKALPNRLDSIYEKLIFKNIIWCSSVLIRKECFEKLGLFDEHLKSCEDWDMWIRISKYYKFIILKTPLIKYLVHPGQKSEDLSGKIVSRKRILFKNEYEFKKRKFLYSHHYYIIGNFCCLNGKTREGRKYLLKGILIYPFCFKYYLSILLSMFGYSFYNYMVKKKRFVLKRLNKIIL